MEVRAEEFRNEVPDDPSAYKHHRCEKLTHKSSNGEMNTSLRLMICAQIIDQTLLGVSEPSHVLVLDMLEQFELAIGALGENRGAERLHDLLDRDRGPRELVFRRTGYDQFEFGSSRRRRMYQTRPKAPVEDEIMYEQLTRVAHPFLRAEGRHNAWLPVLSSASPNPHEGRSRTSKEVPNMESLTKDMSPG
jgi:hypothetical protein